MDVQYVSLAPVVSDLFSISMSPSSNCFVAYFVYFLYFLKEGQTCNFCIVSFSLTYVSEVPTMAVSTLFPRFFTQFHHLFNHFSLNFIDLSWIQNFIRFVASTELNKRQNAVVRLGAPIWSTSPRLSSDHRRRGRLLGYAAAFSNRDKRI